MIYYSPGDTFMNSGILWGVDYYPEQWDESRWDDDIDHILKFGARAIRIMEFSWSIIHPEEGVYDFSLFDRFIEKAANAGLKIVLGTPTAAVPAWLYYKDPSIRQQHPSGNSRGWGSRRYACYNNPAYASAVIDIVEQMAIKYGGNPAVIGWQLDNQIGFHGAERCICPSCRAAWTSWLRNHYLDTHEKKGVEKLNEQWGTVFWGSQVTSFDQIPIPDFKGDPNLNPALLLDYDRFCSDSVIQFMRIQAYIIRTNTNSQWVTMNFYLPPLSNTLDQKTTAQSLDFASFNNYPAWGAMSQPLPYYLNALALDWMRGVKNGQSFAILEQFGRKQGYTTMGYTPPPEQAVLWTNQAIAHGADKLFYFRWRTAPFGQEQLCSGLVDYGNEPTRQLEAYRENIRHAEGLFGDLADTPIPASACIIYEKDNLRYLKRQSLSTGLASTKGLPAEYGLDMEFARQYVPFSLFGVNADIMTPNSVDPGKYRIISLPLYQMADPAFVKVLEGWTETGGNLILHWRDGARDTSGWNSSSPLPGLFSRLAGITIPESESLGDDAVPLHISGTSADMQISGRIWADIIETRGAAVVASYGGRKWYSGRPAVTVNNFGKGRVWFFGTTPSADAVTTLYRIIFEQAGIPAHFSGKGIEVVERLTKEGKRVALILNHNSSDQMVSGKRIPAYGCVRIPL